MVVDFTHVHLGPSANNRERPFERQSSRRQSDGMWPVMIDAQAFARARTRATSPCSATVPERERERIPLWCSLHGRLWAV